MTRLLIKAVEKRKDGLERRSALSSLSGYTGIICNILLCAIKFAVGALTGSVAVTADAVNNLSDSAANIVTLTGTRLSDKPDDKEHPFGHGRIEYVSALIVAISIFVVSFELAKSSVEKIIHPEEMTFGIVYIVLLLAAIGVKLWMAYFNFRLFKLTGNINLKAVMQDSLNDSIATAATVLSLLLCHFFKLAAIDGIIGIAVSVFIFYSGIGILKQVVSPLLGEAPSRETVEKIESIITESDIVLGVHDLVIHSYGANKKLASADAEVDAGADIFTIHDVIDRAEKQVFDELNIEICIHMDPVDKTDTESEKYKLLASGIVRDYNSSFSLHDFILSEANGKKVISFDLQIPFEEAENAEKIKDEIGESFLRLCPEVSAEFNIEHSYI